MEEAEAAEVSAALAQWEVLAQWAALAPWEVLAQWAALVLWEALAPWAYHPASRTTQ